MMLSVFVPPTSMPITQGDSLEGIFERGDDGLECSVVREDIEGHYELYKVDVLVVFACF